MASGPAPASPSPPPASQSLSWSSILATGSSSSSDGLPLHFVPPSAPGSSKVVFCPPDLLSDEAKLWEDCLVGHFLGPRPTFPIVKLSLSKQWRPQGSLDTFLLDNGFFIFKFSSPLDKSRALEGGPWLVGKRPIFLRQWSRQLQLRQLDFSSIPLWIAFPGLPLHFWCTGGLSLIGSAFGKPLFSDLHTRRKDRLAFARICVEVSAAESLPSFITVHEGEGHSFEQEVHYDWLPPQCLTCKTFGHESQFCTFVAKPPVVGGPDYCNPAPLEGDGPACSVGVPSVSAEIPATVEAEKILLHSKDVGPSSRGS
ncbi:uncharacterized protein LOC122648158 [Telopea speciosissima]|uniref:uncharacterized protein LOC122648158 n=1 Tax=Telopea speciosissima TaxID=54955 RepID=UPI001CC3D924|nr:uncharacterized protein LOC122648158 [Telopea speciosissima]